MGVALLGFSLTAQSTVSADLITFDTLAHGQVVDSEFFASDGLTISAINVGGGPDLAVAFDSLSTGNSDDDLEGPPWASGNLAPRTTLGMMLIVQEHGFNDGGFISTEPDDEGSNPAGSIFFDFATPLDSIGFDLIDVEGDGEFGDFDGTEAGFFATFFSGGSALTTVSFGDLPTRDASVVYGNNSANRITPFTIAELGITPFDRVEINFGGSAAIDNLNFTKVPAPGAALLGTLGLGFVGFIGRTRKAKNSS
jgi:hypothetical protein